MHSLSATSAEQPPRPVTELAGDMQERNKVLEDEVARSTDQAARARKEACLMQQARTTVRLHSELRESLLAQLQTLQDKDRRALRAGCGSPPAPSP